MWELKIKYNCRNLNGTVLLQSLTALCWLYTWEQTNSSNKFAANLNMKGISFFYSPCINHVTKFLSKNLLACLQDETSLFRLFKVARDGWQRMKYFFPQTQIASV